MESRNEQLYNQIFLLFNDMDKDTEDFDHLQMISNEITVNRRKYILFLYFDGFKWIGYYQNTLKKSILGDKTFKNSRKSIVVIDLMTYLSQYID